MILEPGLLMVRVIGIQVVIIGHLTMRTKGIGLIGINKNLTARKKGTPRSLKNHGLIRKNPLMETNRLNHLIMPKTGGINLSENAMKIAKSLQLG